MNLEEAKLVLEVQASRMSGITSRTEQRDAALVILDHLAEQGEPEWEYACRDDRTGSVTSVGAPWMDHEYAERVTANEYPYMAGVRRRKAGPWLPVPDTNHESEGKA